LVVSKFVKALESFYYVYSTVEEEFDRQRRNFPKIGALYFEELRRKKSFERDLQFFLGENWRQKLQGPSPTVAQYVEHIKQVSSSKPWLILSYVITL
jgi:heme oxygenase